MLELIYMLSKIKKYLIKLFQFLKSEFSKVIGNWKNRDNAAPVDEGFVVGLDIGTEYVKALIGKINQDTSSIDIVGVGRVHQSLSDMQAGAISDIASVVENCDQALKEAEEQAGTSVRGSVIGIAGELVKGSTITTKIIRPNPEESIDAIEMEKIIGLVQSKAEEKAKDQLNKETGGRDVNVRLVNSALVNIEIDGYVVTNPIGFQGKEVVVSLYTAFAPLIHIAALEKTAFELDLDLLAVAAEPFAVSRAVLGNKISQNFSAILIDIGGGTTDIAVVVDGGVQGTKMFGIGGRAFTKGIERDLGVSYDMAELLKVGLSENTVPANKIAPVEASLNKTAKTWMGGIELALSEFTKLDHLPYRMFLCGGGSSLELLVEKLEETDWYKNLPFTHKPSIHLIKPQQIADIKDMTEKVNDHTFITAMGLLRVAGDTKQFDTKDNSTIRDKIDKMLKV